MVRRVGFGEDDPEPRSKPKKSIADQAMDRFRKRAKNKAAREAEQKKTGRSKVGRILFLFVWLVIWVGISGSVILTMTREGLNTNVIPLVIWTAASILVVTKVIRTIISTARKERRYDDRPENF